MLKKKHINKVRITLAAKADIYILTICKRRNESAFDFRNQDWLNWHVLGKFFHGPNQWGPLFKISGLSFKFNS